MGLIGWYKLDGNALDSAGNNDGNVGGTVSYINGKIGQAFSTDASSGYITTPIQDSDIPVNFSASAWVRIKQWGLSHGVFGTRDGRGWMLYRNSGDANGLLRFYLHYYTTTDTLTATSHVYSGFPLNEWFHVVVVRTQTYYRTYLNGVLVEDSPVPADFKSWSRDGGLFRVGAGGTSWFTSQMDIDDARLYDYSLSSAEAKELSQAKVLHYKFNNFQEPTKNLLATGLNNYTVYNPSHWNGATLTEVGTSEFNTPIFEYDTSGTLYTYTNDFILDDDLADISNKTVTFSVYIKRMTAGATGQIRIYVNNEYTEKSIDVDTSYRRFEVIKTIGINPTRVFIMIDNTGGGVYRFHSPQLEIKDSSTPFVYETRDGIISDNSEYAFNAPLTLSDTPRWTSDSKLGRGSYYFNLLDRVVVPANPNNERILGADNMLSVCAWIKPEFVDGGKGYRAPIVRIDGGSLYFQVYENNRLATYWSGNPNRGYLYSTVNSITLDEWQHVTVVWNNDIIKFYINGELDIRYTSSGIGHTMNDVIRIGYELDGREYKGYIDDVRIYSTALSDSDVSEIYQKRAGLDSYGNFNTIYLNETGHKSLLLDYTQWENGQTGSVGDFTRNGEVSENYRILANDPWGKETVVWEARPDSTSGPDGGWNSPYFSIDKTKMYRFSTWVWRNSINDGGFYLGVNTQGDDVLNRSSGMVSTNPYFLSSTNPFPTDTWALVVGHIFPSDSGTGAIHPDSGIYIINGRIDNIERDYIWGVNTTTVRHRSYLYYATDTNMRQRWVYPRMDVVDGTEPSISDLISGFDSRNIDFVRARGGSNDINLSVLDNELLTGSISEAGITNGLVTWWSFNGNANDISGNGNDGVVNGAEIVGGVNNSGAYYFDGSGTNDGVTPGDNISVNETITRTDNYPNGCTYSVWLNVDTSAADRICLFYGGATINHIEIYSISKVFRTEAALQNGYSFGTGTFPDNVRGTWSHFVIVFANNEPTRPVRWYQNGSLFHTGNMSSGTYPDTEYFSFSNIGRSTGSSSYLYAKSFHGLIDDVRIYNRALSAEEIGILYNVTGDSTNKMKLTKDSIYVKGQIKETL